MSPNQGFYFKPFIVSCVTNIASLLGKRKSAPISENTDQTEAKNEIEILAGTGRITSSGSTIHGHDTQFMSQLSVNDAIIVTHPTT